MNVDTRAVLYFDVSQLPANQIIKKATLSICYSNGSKGTEGSKLYALSKKPDFEHTTWEYSKKDSKWSTAGGEYNTTPMVLVEYTPIPLDWEDYDVTSFIKEYVTNPEKNCGFIIIADPASSGMNMARYYISSENEDDKENRPKLSIEYATDITIPFTQKTTSNVIGHSLGKNSLSLSFPGSVKYRLSITDTKGRVRVHKSDVAVDKTELSLKNLANGVYTLFVKTEGHSYQSPLFLLK